MPLTERYSVTATSIRQGCRSSLQKWNMETEVMDKTLLELLRNEDPVVRQLAQQIVELLKLYEQDEEEEVLGRLRRKM